MAKRKKKKGSEHKVYRWIVAVVGVVAVVGLISMFFGSSVTGAGMWNWLDRSDIRVPTTAPITAIPQPVIAPETVQPGTICFIPESGTPDPSCTNIGSGKTLKEAMKEIGFLL